MITSSGVSAPLALRVAAEATRRKQSWGRTPKSSGRNESFRFCTGWCNCSILSFLQTVHSPAVSACCAFRPHGQIGLLQMQWISRPVWLACKYDSPRSTREARDALGKLLSGLRLDGPDLRPRRQQRRQQQPHSVLGASIASRHQPIHCRPEPPAMHKLRAHPELKPHFQCSNFRARVVGARQISRSTAYGGRGAFRACIAETVC